MKRANYWLWILSLNLIVSMVLLSCNKNKDDDRGSFLEDSKRFKTEKAEALGAAITKMIGPEGGVLTYGDEVEIEVPAGAVDMPTTFSIQPVKSRIQPHSEKVNYELLPHGVTFNKPVKITFSYDPSALSTSEDVLQVAYRKEEGTWHSLPTEINKNNQTLTVTKESFSEFEFYEKFILHADRSSLASGESTELSVGFIYEDYEGLIAPLTPHFLDGESCYFLLDKGIASKVGGWTIVEGSGKIVPKNNFQSIATYTAPSQLNATEAIVQVRIEGIRNGMSQGAVLILRKSITLSDGWIKLTMDGQTHLLTHNTMAVQLEDYSFGVAGTNADKSLDIAVIVILKGRQAGPGTYSLGLLEPGTSIVSLYENNLEWAGLFYDCSVNTAQVGEGSVNIISWSHTPGEMTKGEFTGTLYYMVSECEKDSKTVHIEFEIPRSAPLPL